MTLNLNVLNKVICEGDCVLVGVSGGADSMCLLDLVHKFSEKRKFVFYAVHINHNLRHEEALRDENFVKDFCEKRGINFVKESINTLKYANEKLKTIEQAGRELRYKTFQKLSCELKTNKLLIAHHKDDQAETVFMHIARGASIKGARGIQKQTNNIYRPLLNFTRKEIEEYNKKNNVAYIMDSSNQDVKYTRNYIRNIVFPSLMKIYPNFVNSLCNFAEKCAQDEEFIDKQVKKYMVRVQDNAVLINVNGLKDEYPLSSRLVKYAIEKLDIFADIEEKHIKDIINLSNKENGKFINLTNGLVAYKEYSYVVIKMNNDISFDSQAFSLGEFYFGEQCKFSVELSNTNNSLKMNDGCLYLDLDKVPSDALFRTRKNGDIFKKFGSGTKKLNDYFIDKKIAKRTRDFIPVLASGNKVLCVIGKEISEDVKVTENTKNIVKICQKI